MPPKNHFVNIYTSITFLISLLVFSGILYFKIPTDLQDHIVGLILIIDHQSFPIPPLYYFMVFLFSGCSTDINVLYIAAAFILSASVGLKYFYSTKLITNLNQTDKHDKWMPLILCLMLFTAPIAYDYRQMFIGRISPNVWHNSTTIFLMPFTILLFQKAINFLMLKHVMVKDTALIILFGFLNVLIKPSFLFPFIPAFATMAYLNSGFKSRIFKMTILVCLILGFFIFLEYYAVYRMTIIDAVRFSNDTKGIEIKPFNTLLVLNNGSWNYMFLNFFVSLLFPLTCLVLLRKELKHNIIIKFTILIFFFSLLIGILISEKGIMANNGNFIWQLYISNYLLFLVSIKFTYNYISSWGWFNKKSIMIIAVFGIHVISGFLYLAKIFYLKKYS